MQSRVHLAIQYHELTSEARVEIYLNCIKRIPDDAIENRRALEAKVADSRLTRRSETNGRQIRNIVVGALSLASGRNEKLRIEHLEEVDRTTSDFIKGMAALTEKQRAR